MKSTKQMSDSIRLGAILAVSGGFMDAYSYIQRDEVFANAQTGNILLFGVKLSEGDFAGALQYFFPVLAFVLGISAAELVRMRGQRILHWRQISVINEAVILAAVAFIPLTQNILANSLISFACGIQVESFRKIRGNGIATTMCIGNIRSGNAAPLPVHSQQGSRASCQCCAVLRYNRLFYHGCYYRQLFHRHLARKGHPMQFRTAHYFVCYHVHRRRKRENLSKKLRR